MKVSVPSQHPTKIIDFQRLDGGLNLWELDYRLAGNQSPDMKNLWWQDGLLQCRDGQVYLYGPGANDADWVDLGTGYTCFSEFFWDNAFFHIGDMLYRMDMTAEEKTMVELVSGVPESRGTFFRYDRWLFYKNRGGFYRIGYDPDGETTFPVTNMADTAYVPVIQMNTDPVTGAGDLYQPENRLSAKKKVQFNAKADTKVYQLPVKEIDAVVEARISGTVTTAYTVDLTKGTVTFNTAPPTTNPATNNTVEITFSKANEDALASIMDCPYAAVYGGESNVCIVLGGSSAQPNAFFWNSNDAVSMNAGYWPMTYYQLAGDTEDGVTGFGIQYGTLIVLKQRSVGKAGFEIVALDGRQSISLTYIGINDRIGCDLPWTIQLVENNVVFCNSSSGVHIVRDSSSAMENNIECISRNINGTEARPGLLAAVRDAGPDVTCCFDDDNRYWVCAGGKAYLWDYVLSSWKDPSWFYFTEVPGVAYIRHVDKSYHLDGRGRVTVFRRVFTDYDGAIEKVYQFPPQFFDSYDRLKDIMYCIFTIRSDTDSVVDILYESDYEARHDLTPIQSLHWRLSPRNLAYRCLNVQKFAFVARRKPGCRHVRHFSMRLSNNTAAQDLSILSAQIYFRYLGRDR